MAAAAEPKKSHKLRNVLVITIVAGGGIAVYKFLTGNKPTETAPAPTIAAAEAARPRAKADAVKDKRGRRRRQGKACRGNAADAVGSAAKSAGEKAKDVASDVKDKAADVKDAVADKVEDLKDAVADKADDVKDAGDKLADAKGDVKDAAGRRRMQSRRRRRAAHDTCAGGTHLDPGGGADRTTRCARRRRAPQAGATGPSHGKKLLRLEVRNAQTPIEKKPEWIKTRLRTGPEYLQMQSLVRREGLHTVCQEAGCPNIFECWEDREATFLIGGDQCTRRCDFCLIDTGKPERTRPGRAAPGRRVDPDDGSELRDHHRGHPGRPARTRVPGSTPRRFGRSTRWATKTGVEILTPDFSGKADLLRRSSTPSPRCSHTIWRPCRGSSSGSGRRSGTTAHWTSSPRRARPGW